VGAIVADKIAPGLLDRYLARTGDDSQQYNGAEDPNRLDNLSHPVPGDRGAHGTFDARSKSWSSQLWASEHRALVALAMATLVTCGLLALFKEK